MRIAFVHSFYRSENPSGENAVVHAEIGALRRAGYEVELFAAHTDDLQRSRSYDARTSLRVMTRRGHSPLDELRDYAPDVVHVHNLFPNFSTKWVWKVDVPLVATLHNFRPLCAAATLHRDGRQCTDCVTRSWPSLLHACYRDSRLATLPLTIGNRRGGGSNDLLRRADRVLVLSEFARSMLVRAGLDEGRLEIVANFVPDDIAPEIGEGGGGFLFAGRLSAEKGILPLIERWPDDVPLSIAGSGPQEDEVRAAIAGKTIRLLGALTRPQVIAAMRDADGLVFPSVSAEGFPLVYAEALAAGLPVLAFEGSAVADLVTNDRTGAVISWDEPLLGRFEGTLATARAECRRTFDRLYSECAFRERAARLYASQREGDGGTTSREV